MSILKLKDSQGNWVGVPTLKGDKGNGIQSAVLNNDYTLTLTFTDGTTYTTPSIRGEKGEQGEPATDMDIHICSTSEYDSETRIPTIANPDDKTFYLVPTEDGTSPDLFTEWVYVNNAWEMFGSASVDLSGYLTDVQINGTSIVEDGVANVPIGLNKAGVVQISGNPAYGLNINGNTGLVTVASANDAEVKAGTLGQKPIAPQRQHMSTFYGLAKASGDTTQSASSNAVGNYTEDAKSAIQNMLGITDKYTPKDWIAESETELVTNAHNIGELFYIGETLYKVIADLNAGDAINVGVNVEEVNVNDILDDYATKEDVQDNVSIVEKSASGAVASFSDGADNLPLKSLIVNIDPVQDLHGYDSPYPAGGGKNKIPFPYNSNSGTVDGITYTIGDDGKITATGTTERGTNFFFVRNMTLTAGTYTASVIGDFAGLTLMFYDSVNKVTVCNILPAESKHYKTFTIESDKTVNIYLNTSQTGVTVDISAYFQLEQGSTATAYAPYSNICPISGWTGMEIQHTKKNLLPLNIWDGISYNKNVGTVFNPSMTNESWTQGNGKITYMTTAKYTTMSLMTPLLPVGTYHVTVEKLSGGALRYTKYILDKSYKVLEKTNSSNVASKYSTSHALTEPCYMAFRLDNGVTAEQTVELVIQIEVGDTETSYEPYQGQTIPISWQTEAGTVYGGKLDVLSGVMTITMALTDLGILTWTYNNTSYAYGFFASGNISGKAFGSSNIVCSQYKTIHGGRNMLTSNATICPYNTTTSNAICVRDDAYTDATEFKTAMRGVQLVYELAEPIEIQLTPNQVNSLLGVNNIFADTGDISVEYFSQVDKDLIDYIETSLKPYAKEEKLNDYVSDVQIDGNSIVTDGVAEIPIASTTQAGVVKVNSTGANGLLVDNQELFIIPAASNIIKDGTHMFRPIAPKRQHESTFFGLAKAAGDATQSASANAVGTYTDEAKTAIKQMLGIHDTIDSFIEEVTGTDVTITGQPSYRYNCGELYSLTVTPPSSGTIDFRFTSGSTPTVLTLPSTVKMPEWWVEVEANTIYEMCITDGIYCGVMTWAM